MADVRLTATNPEDSSVVPVACDAAGRLLLEEPQVVEGPPGPQGEQGPPGQNGQDGQDGDPFSGNFAGDVTFGGSVEFAGYIYCSRFAPNNIYIGDGSDGKQYAFYSTAGDGSKINIGLGLDGSAEFAGDVVVDGNANFAGEVSCVTGIFRGAQTSDIAISTGYWPSEGSSLWKKDAGNNLLTFVDAASDSEASIVIGTDGNATNLQTAIGNSRIRLGSPGGQNVFQSPKIDLNGSDGSASFNGDVVVGSRYKQWMLVEQGGLCHMVEQVRATTADLPARAVDGPDGKYPELRDVFAELNIVEKALEEVMVKLHMQVPAGWPVWDGSDEISTLPRQNS